MNLLPTKRQWNKWSLPNKIAFIGTLITLIMFGLYVIEKTFNIYDWAFNGGAKPVINVDLQFPYERLDNIAKQNKRNPKITITNRGSDYISPIVVDVNMFTLTPSLEEAVSVFKLTYVTHGHLIYESDLKPGTSVTSTLAGIKNWSVPVAYDIKIDMYRHNDKKKFTNTLLYLIDNTGIMAEGSKLPVDKSIKIRTAIDTLNKSNKLKKKVTLTAPLDGIWVAQPEPGINMKFNKDGTSTIQ